MIEISEKDFDQLALDSAEIIGFKSGATVDYDVAGYGRCVRSEVSPESLSTKDSIGEATKALPSQAVFDDEPYIARLAGFRRRDQFGPDQIGEILNSHSIAWTDGLGNGLFESLLICKKYGLRHVIEAPILGFPIPFLEGEWDEFRWRYRTLAKRLINDLFVMEPIYGGKFTGIDDNLVVLWARDYPLANFLKAYQREPELVCLELQDVIGFARLSIEPETKEDRLALLKFWNWIREKQSRIQIVQADILREELGSGVKIVANPHELPVLDFEGQARAFDIPSVAIRPLLIENDLMLKHYIGYLTQLYHDLTAKRPMVSVRMNLSAATPKFIPTGKLIRRWYDQAVRHGAGSFYFWTRDYPPDGDPMTYDGPIPGNPVLSTLPKERWETSLEILGSLSTHKKFELPEAEIAILIPTESALLRRKEWLRIYSAFSALAELRIFSQFISDRQIEKLGISENVHLIIVPELEFLSLVLKEKLEAYIKDGGVVLTANTDFYNRIGVQSISVEGIEKISTSTFDIFTANGTGSTEKLNQAGNQLLMWIEKIGLDAKSWIFDIQCSNLPASSRTWLRQPDSSVYFAPWQYEHGSEWIMPYVREVPLDE